MKTMIIIDPGRYATSEKTDCSSDAEYREAQEKCTAQIAFQAGMGASAVQRIYLKQVEL